MNKFVRLSTAFLASSALAFAPLATAAQTSTDPNAAQMEALRALIAAGQESSGVTEQLRQLNERVEALLGLADQVKALQAQVAADAAKVSGLESAIATMAQTLVSVEELAQKAVAQLADARSTAEGIVDQKFAGLLDGVGNAIADSADIANLPVDEALAKMEEARKAAEALREEFLRQGDVLQGRLDRVCTEAIPEELRGPLSMIVGEAIPQNWTANIAATAAENGLNLPDCFGTPDENGRTAEQEVMEYLAKRQASQEMANAMNTMMMMAMSTGNPYIIAAAVVIMALMAIFGDSGGGGGGEGDGQGSGTGPDSGNERTTGNGTEQDENGGQNPGVSPEVSGPGVVTPAPLTPPVEPGYTNVKEGVDTIVRVSGQIITLTDAATKKEWIFDWPEKFSPLELDIPDFNDSVFIEAADAVARTITVTLLVPDCVPNTPLTFALKADPNNPTVPILDGETQYTCIQ